MLYAVGFSKTDVCGMRYARITHTKNRTAYLPTAYSVYTLTLSYLDRVVDNLGLLRRNYAYPTKTPNRRIGTPKNLIYGYKEPGMGCILLVIGQAITYT